MTKLDLRKEYKRFYNPPVKSIEILEVPTFKFLMIDGKIEPGKEPGNSPGFQDAMQALYGAAYTLKFMSKLSKENPLDFTVMALEGLWWFADEKVDIKHKDNWVYTVMIMQPDHITDQMFNHALEQMRKKKGDSPAYGRLRLESFREGLCVQAMHIGPYDTEPATKAKMEAFAQEKGYRMTGRHHEIYLGNPLRAQPEKLKTVLRQPVTK